jgi:head-tail adaptor
MAIECYYSAAEIYSVADTKGTFGELTRVLTKVEDVQAYIKHDSTAERVYNDKNEYSAVYKMYCPVTATIGIDSYVKYDGKMYQVISIPQNTAHQDHHLKIILGLFEDD